MSSDWSASQKSFWMFIHSRLFGQYCRRKENPLQQSTSIFAHEVCIQNSFYIIVETFHSYVYFSIDRVAADSIKAGEAVWFGCEVNKRFAGKLGLEDLKMSEFYLLFYYNFKDAIRLTQKYWLVYFSHDFSLVFGTDIQTTLSKADRVIFGESSMTHAMVFTAVSVSIVLLYIVPFLRP